MKVGSAPCSFGVFELTIDRFPNIPGPDELLDAMRDGGYEGTDLGPVGYFGGGEELAARLSDRALKLAGGYCPIRFTEPESTEQDLSELRRVLDVFRTVSGHADFEGRPKPTLADAGSPSRSAAPGWAQRDSRFGLDAAGWASLVEGVTRAADLCLEAGFEPTFHHHAGTYVEEPREIERLLELTTVGLCLDTGHLLLGGGDPITALKDWGERINHIHVKDVRMDVVRDVVGARGSMEEVWQAGAFCPFGEGDLDLDGFLQALDGLGYSGWLLVEQDRFPAASLETAARDQASNRAFLRERGI